MIQNDTFVVPTGGYELCSKIIEDIRPDYCNPYVCDMNFPLVVDQPRQESVIVFLPFHEYSKFEEVLSFVAKNRPDLKRPTFEHALRFADKYREIQRNYHLVFLHEPWLAPDGYKGVISLYGGKANRSIGMDWFGYKAQAKSYYAFVK